MWRHIALLLVGAALVTEGCEVVRVEMCRGLGYNMTGMPNLAGHELQADADFTLQTFAPLVQYGCSARLHLLLCAVYVPMCTDKVASPIGPCRPLCESVRSRCLPVLQGFGFPWPAALDCARFPADNDHRHMCMQGPPEASAAAIPPAGPRPGPLPLPPPFPRPRSPCSSNASEVLFSPQQQHMANAWLTLCALLATVCPLLGLFARLAAPAPAPTAPQPPPALLLHLAVCYAGAGLGWSARLLMGPASASAAFCHHRLLAHDLPAGHGCVLVFLLLYYFNNAASVWWVMTVLCWFLQTGLGWTPARIQNYTTFFHITAWVLPAVNTVLIVFMRRIDADELTGTCYVGNQDSTSLIAFVLVPQLACLLLVGSMLILGFLTSIGHSRKGGRGSAVLALLFLAANSCVVATYFYELWNRDDWIMDGPPTGKPRRAKLWVPLVRLSLPAVLAVVVGLCVCFSRSQSWFWSMDAKQKPTIPQDIHYFPPPKQRLHKTRSHRKHNGETLV
ncbi:frizzled-4-like [Nilaparvata lugens]|uniref:frizzled-4-like n=1 Tax=Nilaparvata lugens TaxID=108931 RepID=UPI00193CDBAC|nr:frizzled-4-like [Nilaparvata lugens]